MHGHGESVDWNGIGGPGADSRAPAGDLDRCNGVCTRRRFMGWSGGGALLALGGFGAGLGAAVSGLFGRGLTPVAWAEEGEVTGGIPSKPGITIHALRPLTGEFSAHLLDDDVTPTHRHFVRNNSAVPERATAQDPQGWKLTVDGEVHRPLALTMDDLKSMPSVTLRLLIECAGNGRALFDPPVRGAPWQRGAVGCSEWTGVRLRDILRRAGLAATAKYTAHYGEDPPMAQLPPFSRGIPIDKAMEEHTLVAYAMNGQDLPALHGYPVRLVVPGWVGSCSQKWLNRIWVRDREHDSPKMSGYSYRVPRHPVVPGTRPPESDMVIVTSWPIKSLITQPAADEAFAVNQTVRVAGHAWAGENQVSKVEVSIDFGMHWTQAKLTGPRNKYAWYRFETSLSFPQRGYYEIWSRAFDDKGGAQPLHQPWNPRGYLANVIHRLPVQVGA